MTQPPPDRAPEEQVSESVLASIESMGYTVHVTGKLLREMVRDCREAARLRARGVADEAARKVADLYVEEQQLGYSHKFTDPCACARCRLRWAVQGYQFALAATRAGNETNKAGEGSASGNAAGARQGVEAPSPATSTAEATAETEAGSHEADHRVAWPRAKDMALLLHDKSRSFIEERVYALLRDMLTERRAALESHAAAAVKRARAECAKAAAELNEWLQKRCNWYQTEIARKRACAEAAEADVARMQALVNREVTECERLRDEVAGLKTAAQPARQPAASGEARDYTADLRAALLALGFDWPADPRSPREVFRDELLPRIRVLVSNERHWWAKAKACETLHGARP